MPEARSARRPRETLAEKRARKGEIDDPGVVFDAGLRFLEARARSVTEVRRRLSQAGYREDLVTGAIDRLSEIGMLDDEVFATQWVESRDRAHPRGEHALMLELRQKGIDATLIATILRERREAATRWDGGGAGGDDNGADAEPNPTPDEAAARKLLLRHARALERVTDPRARRQKAYALLARNGFGPEVASAMSRELERQGAAADVSEDDGP
jgi:SOS response regulatory protein OraA/RecX